MTDSAEVPLVASDRVPDIAPPMTPSTNAPPVDTGASPAVTARFRMPHLPALDGLRGLAVIGVLLFHSGFSWARGGFLGVSTFFTLSGFLITNLLVREWDSSDAIRLGSFWSRRFRRLLPAAVVTIALVGLVFWRLGSPETIHALRFDMIGALTYSANWRFYFSSTSYGSLFTDPSPLQHFWSLAIEEQFYVFFPPIVLIVMRWGGRRLLTSVVALATGVSVALTLFLHTDLDRVYYGTDTRAAELLLGVLLALWWSSARSDGRLRSERTRPTWWLELAGLAALVAMFVAWTTIADDSSWVAGGGLPLYAVGTVLVIWAGTRRGVVTSILSVRILRTAGLLSYGLYLYHWPVFLVLSPSRTHLSPWPLFAVRMAVTLLLAITSYRLVEMPIRRGRLLTSDRSALVTGVAFVVLTSLLAVVITLHPPPRTVAYADVKIGEAPDPTRTGSPDTPIVDGTKHSVLVIGDSGTADLLPALDAGLHSAGVSHVDWRAFVGWGLTGGDEWRTEWPTVIAEQHIDLVIMMFGGWDMRYYSEHGADSYLPVVEDALHVFTDAGIPVVLLPMLPGGVPSPKGITREQIDAVFTTAAADVPGVIRLEVDHSLAAPDGTYPRVLTLDDGTAVLLRKADDWHLCPEGAQRFASALLDRLAGLGFVLPADTDWAAGTWRDAKAYNDPPGACVGP